MTKIIQSLTFSEFITNLKSEPQKIALFLNELQNLDCKLHELVEINDFARSQNDYESAEIVSSMLISKYPNSYVGYARNARDNFILGKITYAEEICIKGLCLFPIERHLLSINIDILYKNRLWSKCLDTLKVIIANYPDIIKNYFIAINCCKFLSLFDEGLNYYNKAAKLDPNNDSLVHLGVELYCKTDFDKMFDCALHLESKKITSNSNNQSFNTFLSYNSCKDSIVPSEQKFDNLINYYFNSNYILSHKDLAFNFIYAPKNACSSIKATLLAKINPNRPIDGTIHVRSHKELHQAINYDKKFVALTRDPVKRFISGYIDKCTPNSDDNVWLPICKRYGFDHSKIPNIDYFLDALVDDNPLLINEHFRPQSLIFNNLIIEPTLFKMENIKDLIDYFQRNGLTWVDYRPHTTKKSSLKPENLSESTIKKICTLYESDFINYSYDTHYMYVDNPCLNSKHFDNKLKSICNIEKYFQSNKYFDTLNKAELFRKAFSEKDWEALKIYLVRYKPFYGL